MPIANPEVMLPRLFTNTCADQVSVLVWLTWVAGLVSFLAAVRVFQNILEKLIFPDWSIHFIRLLFLPFHGFVLLLHYPTFHLLISLFLCSWPLIILSQPHWQLILLVKSRCLLSIIVPMSMTASSHYTFRGRNFEATRSPCSVLAFIYV